MFEKRPNKVICGWLNPLHIFPDRDQGSAARNFLTNTLTIHSSGSDPAVYNHLFNQFVEMYL
jgi:hypothetical protein